MNDMYYEQTNNGRGMIINDEVGVFVGRIVSDIMEAQLKKNPHIYYASLSAIAAIIAGAFSVSEIKAAYHNKQINLINEMAGGCEERN